MDKLIQYIFRLFVSLISSLPTGKEEVSFTKIFALFIVIDICSWFIIPRFPMLIELIVILIYMVIIDGIKHNNTATETDEEDTEIKSYIANLAWERPDLDEDTLRNALLAYGVVPDKYISYWQSCYKPTNKLTNKKNSSSSSYEQMQKTPKVFENNRCKITYDGYTKSISCKDKKIVDGVQKKFITIENYGTNSVDMWLIIAQHFNDQITYQQLRDILRQVATLEESKVKPEQHLPQEKLPQHFGIVDVNTAGEDELCSLPGVNKIQAKKIIQFRERERYFNSREDFFETMKIKEHFRKQMKIMVVANPVGNTVKMKQKEAERIVDF